MDDKKLIEFCKANPYAMKLILELAEDYNPRGYTNVSEAVSTLVDVCEINVGRSQIIALFRQLEKFECGLFFVGRKGHLSRFHWSIDIKLIAKTLKGNSSGEGTSPKASAPPTGTATAHSSATLRHTFHLRQDFELILNLPTDLTEKDAQRISKFVESLPQ
jgi:hypothetical protein